MMTPPQTLQKMRRLEQTYDTLLFEPVQTLVCSIFETEASFHQVPGPEADWRDCPSGTSWGKAWCNAWFSVETKMPEAYSGRPVYLVARTGAVESMFWLNGEPAGIFNYDPWIRNRGDHRAQLVTESATSDCVYTLAVEGYAGHPTMGSQPFDSVETQKNYPYPFRRTFDRLELCLRNDLVNDFILDLRVLNQLSEALSADSFRKGAIDAALARVFCVVVQDPAEVPREEWLAGLEQARSIMRPLLECRNGDSAPLAGLTGHSHMDTAWHWPVEETIRKCARTFSNALALMKRYPEYRFIQSSVLHLDWMRSFYPSIFEGIKTRVAEGRWEPNGGSWVEPDVNLAGGEALIRHFLRGQTYTRRHLGYTADTFWLPDSFGYPAALPQIMRGCGIKFFLTTKLTWNESNTFPYDTFWWEGLDGSRIFTHFNDTHCAPDPATLISKLHGTGGGDFRVVENQVRHKDVNRMRLISYGYGDGGGGPDPRMIEVARRCRDLEGCPRAEHISVSAFMQRLRAEAPNAPCFVGELYFESHRGTLTQMHEIKRRNRRAEMALRDAEYLLVLSPAFDGPAACERIAELWDILLLNQFHDILPGTSIAEVHDRAVGELGTVIEGAQKLARETTAFLVKDSVPGGVTLFNALSWIRNEVYIPPLTGDAIPIGAGLESQSVETPWGERRLVLYGSELPPLSAKSFECAPAQSLEKRGPFMEDGSQLTTPWLRIRLAADGSLESLYDLKASRELCNGPVNQFLFGEDVPAAWDNWDIDADLVWKLKPLLHLDRREVVANGPLQLRIRQHFTFGQGSSLVQDLVVHTHTPRLDFETTIDWREKHRFLAVSFPLNLRVVSARHEIQFGHVERPTHRNFAEDRARFEVCQHKWTDLSENRYGVALLNDGKYGISVEGNTLRLSLHKGGCHPDGRGDAGTHTCTYSLLPHLGGFAAETVVRPAYEQNVPVTVSPGRLAGSHLGLFTVEAPNIIVEAAKPAAHGRGYTIRLYECERQATHTALHFRTAPGAVFQTNLLEEEATAVEFLGDTVHLSFKPFEIVTLRIIPAET